MFQAIYTYKQIPRLNICILLYFKISLYITPSLAVTFAFQATFEIITKAYYHYNICSLI